MLIDATLDALYGSRKFVWHKEIVPYDIVNPFGDQRASRELWWIFDLHRDILLRLDQHSRTQIPLRMLRAGTASLADFGSLSPPVPLVTHPVLDLSTRYWKPQFRVDERTRVLLHRILRDFNHQWRHLLRNDFNFHSLRVLTRAIIRLLTLDFEIRHDDCSHKEWVTTSELPSWEPFNADVVQYEDVHIIMCQSIQDGMLKAKAHAACRHFNITNGRDDCGQIRPDYVILSVKQVVLCRTTDSKEISFTAPEPLFNGNYGVAPPSDLAPDYLLWSISPTFFSATTRLHSLPLEIQDMVLHHVSTRPFEKAKLGCLLGIGSLFSWKHGPQELELHHYHGYRRPCTPVEFHLFFETDKVGVTYIPKAARIDSESRIDDSFRAWKAYRARMGMRY